MTVDDVTDTRDRSTRVTCAAEGCGVEFAASRSDAKYCSATCRQRARRKRHDPLSRGERPARPVRDGTRKRQAGEYVESIIGLAPGDTVRAALQAVDVQGAVTEAGAPLERWDRELTETIQVLNRLRRIIRDELRRHESA